MGIHALPFSTLSKSIPNPYGSEYPHNPQTIGEHVRKKRIELKLLQEDVAKLIGVSTDTITNWENNHAFPVVGAMPGIIEFLGYIPLTFNLSNLGEKVKLYRTVMGLSHKKLALFLGVNATTVRAWENNTSYPRKPTVSILEGLFESSSFIVK